MSAPAAADGPAPTKAKGKKMLVTALAVVLLLVLGAAGWFFFLRSSVTEEGEEPAPAAHAAAKSTTPPVFLPLDNLVVNLADPGGDRFIQVGITIGVVDQHTSDAVKAHLPTIRSAILLLISQRTSGELLNKQGKEKLAEAIVREVAKPLGYEVESETPEDEPAPKKKAKKKHVVAANPIVSVLFSSFIIQ